MLAILARTLRFSRADRDQLFSAAGDDPEGRRLALARPNLRCHSGGHTSVPGFHPELGAITLHREVLSDADHSQRIVVYLPTPGTGSKTKLHLAAAINHHRFRS